MIQSSNERSLKILSGYSSQHTASKVFIHEFSKALKHSNMLQFNKDDDQKLKIENKGLKLEIILREKCHS